MIGSNTQMNEGLHIQANFVDQSDVRWFYTHGKFPQVLTFAVSYSIPLKGSCFIAPRSILALFMAKIHYKYNVIESTRRIAASNISVSQSIQATDTWYECFVMTEALVHKQVSYVMGTTEYFDKIQNNRYSGDRQHIENLFRRFY